MLVSYACAHFVCVAFCIRFSFEAVIIAFVLEDAFGFHRALWVGSPLDGGTCREGRREEIRGSHPVGWE